MILIKEVKTKKEERLFLSFPYKLYKGNRYYVPALYSEEKKIFKKNYFYNETSKSIFLLAYKDKKVVGRIQGIISYASNDKWNQKRVRFTRFDSINDKEVAFKLFNYLIKWAKDNDMNEINGPLGYSDLEREGLLIRGFNYLNTYEEQYNYPYYQELIESYGFKKEVDWYENRIFKPVPQDEKIDKLIELVKKKYKLRVLKNLTKKELLNKYGMEIFSLFDQAYSELYQTVPLTKSQMKAIIDNFSIMLRPELMRIIVDEEDKIAAVGFCLPSISDALKGGSGKLSNPITLIKVLKSVYKPKVLDFALIGLSEKYQSSGIAAVIFKELFDFMDGDYDYCETNLTLENNHNIRNCWKRFDHFEHKIRRCYIKKIDD